MVDLSLLQSISYMAGALGVCIAAIFYVLNLRVSQRNQELMLKAQQQTLETRQAQLFMGIYQSLISSYLSEAEYQHFNIECRDVNDWNKIMSDKEQYKVWNSYGAFLEGIGVLVHENLIDVRLPAMLCSGTINWYWEKFGPGIKQVREALHFPRIMIEFEYLYGKVNEYAKLHPELMISAPSSDNFAVKST
jgi:hypothetical protein